MSLKKLQLDGLAARVGEEIGVSPWLLVAQERIDLFARAIDDPQWIHVDPVRAKDGPFGTTIAHGFLTLSLLSHLIETTFSVDDRKMGINYGLNKVRFTAPLPCGSRIRAHFVLAQLEPIAGNGMQSVWGVSVEREGSDKPVLVAEWVTRSYS
ncbi:MAG: MaoC family dehydratase [Betaproteobacteria bacterium]|nr:MaoC family dehydratase [Betaproteobacteria bacterium]